jgi:hypothetical protein
MPPLEQIQQHFRSLRMPTAVEIVGDLLTTATRETWPLETFLSRISKVAASAASSVCKNMPTYLQAKPWQLSTRRNYPCASPANWRNYAAANL